MNELHYIDLIKSYIGNQARSFLVLYLYACHRNQSESMPIELSYSEQEKSLLPYHTIMLSLICSF